jgi:hypothetical protein
MLTTLIGITKASPSNGHNIKPVEITLTPTGFFYTNFYEAWSYKNKLIVANDLATTEWMGNLQVDGDNKPFISTMIIDALVKMNVNLETFEGPHGPPEPPLVGSWGKAVVKATWVFEGVTYKGQIIYKYDHVDAYDWRPVKDEWIPNPGLITCHYHGVLNGPMGQQIRLFGTNTAGEFLVKLEGYMTEN